MAPRTRNSTSNAAANGPPAPAAAAPSSNGKKRKASVSAASASSPAASPAGKKKKQQGGADAPKPESELEQQTLEQTLGTGTEDTNKNGNANGNGHGNEDAGKGAEGGDGGVGDEDMKSAGDAAGALDAEESKAEPEGEKRANGDGTAKGEAKEGENVQAKGEAKEEENAQANGNATEEGTKNERKEEAEKDAKTTVDPADGAVQESSQRANEAPSNVLEKGIFYFFARARVGLGQPSSVQEIARSYLVLRPLPTSAKLGEANLEDLGNNRVLALPKKVLPKTGTDRFMVFVDKASATIDDIKRDLMAGSTYETQTVGTRASPPVTPLAEGVYAVTTTGRESHLAYMLTLPEAPGEVQAAVGLAERGSFVLSTKNPEAGGPSYAQLDDPARFSQDIMDAFAGRRWMPTEPAHLAYVGAQVLLIGEAQGDLGKAVEKSEGDGEEKKSPEEEMQLLEDEDLKRVQALKGDDTIFQDLGISKKDYPRVQTTW